MKKISLPLLLSIFLPIVFFFSMAPLVSASLLAPANFRTTATTGTSASFAWDASAGSASYQVEEASGNVNDQSTTATTIQITGLTANTSYTFFVVAVASNGTDFSAPSNSVIVTPSSVSPTNGACGSSSGQSFSSAPTANLCSAGTASTVSGTGPWTWQCNGQNGGTNTSCSATLTNSGGNSTIAPPTGLTATASSGGAFVQWTPSTTASVTGYNVYYTLGSVGATTKANTDLIPQSTNSEVWSLQIPNMVVGTVYNVSIEAVDNAGNASSRATASFTATTAPGGAPPQTPPGGIPPAPTNGGFQFNVQLNNPLGNGATDIPTLLQAILKALLEFLAPVIVVLIIWAGFLFVTAQGNPTKITKAKEVLLWTLVGAAIILGANIIATILSTTVTNILSGK